MTDIWLNFQWYIAILRLFNSMLINGWHFMELLVLTNYIWNFNWVQIKLLTLQNNVGNYLSEYKCIDYAK